MKHTLNTIGILVILSLLLGSVAACARPTGPATTPPAINPTLVAPQPLNNWPEQPALPAGIAAGHLLIGESAALRLYMDQETSHVIVEDKRNGRLWRSLPADAADNPELNNAWRKRITSALLVNYVGEDHRQIKVADMTDRDASLEISPVMGGAQVRYRLPESGFEAVVLYTVRDDALEITVPDAGLVESGANALVSLQVLPFFGAVHDGEPGYLFFPDGSGALIHYSTRHPEEAQEISRVIYGDDTLPDPNAADTTFREPVLIPVFGMVHGDAGYMSIITRGDFDAKLTLTRSGKRNNYNHCGAEFLYRRQGMFSLEGGRPIQVYEPNRSSGDRQIRTLFLTAEEANYVGMAQRYREYLIAERGARRLTAPPSMHLTLFMGVERRTWFLRELITVTDFADAAALLDDLAQQGVTGLSVTLRGWNTGGDGSRYPLQVGGSLPVESRFGGETGLRALIEQAHARGQRIWLYDNLLEMTPNARGVLPSRDAIRGINELPVGSNDKGYKLNPQVALERFAAVNYPRLKPLAHDGMTLEPLAALAVPDANTSAPQSRESFAATWMQIAALAREQFGAAALTGGNAYAVPYADLFTDVAMDSTHYDLIDETVPFYQIAVHGLVAYTGQPHTLLSDERRQFLRQVEYGATPHFLLTWEDSALLYRTPANWIWSSQYSDWRTTLLEQYQALAPTFTLRDQFITHHERLAEGVYQTTYENGARVIVNYGARPYQDGAVQVAGEDFTVITP